MDVQNITSYYFRPIVYVTILNKGLDVQLLIKVEFSDGSLLRVQGIVAESDIQELLKQGKELLFKDYRLVVKYSLSYKEGIMTIGNFTLSRDVSSRIYNEISREKPQIPYNIPPLIKTCGKPTIILQPLDKKTLLFRVNFPDGSFLSKNMQPKQFKKFIVGDHFCLTDEFGKQLIYRENNYYYIDNLQLGKSTSADLDRKLLLFL